MIIGIGTDILDCRRIEKTILRYGDRFLNKIFSKEEIALSEGRNQKIQSYGKTFAAKEAVLKSISSLILPSLKDIEIVRTNFGPKVVFRGILREILNRQDKQVIVKLSISDEPPYAQAFAIACFGINSNLVF